MNRQRTVALGDIAEIVQGGRLRLSGKHFVPIGVPAYGAGGLNGYLEVAEFDKPAVILSSVGARCGKCFLAEGAWTSLANTQLIFPDAKVADFRFLWYQLNDERRWPRSGTGQPFIKPSDVKAHRVYLPPLAEQHRIAVILGRTDELRSKRRHVIAKLNQLLPSLFLQMFGDPMSNPMRWPELPFGRLVESTKLGLVRGSADFGISDAFDTPYIRMDAISREGTLLTDKVQRTNATPAEIRDVSVAYGDMLFNTRNSEELVGKTAVVEFHEPWTFNNNLMRIRFNDKADSFYVLHYLLSRRGRTELGARKSGTTNVFAIYYRDLQSLPVLSPPRQLQNTFSVAAQKIRERVELCTGQGLHINKLFETIRSRAFCGTL